jgi:Mn2+/Fe2+ NRAMP family transporter
MKDVNLPGAPDGRIETAEPPRRRLFQILGPGLITGASDDDPSGIATYSQAGAQFGYDLGWTLFFSWPAASPAMASPAT